MKTNSAISHIPKQIGPINTPNILKIRQKYAAIS